MHHAKPFLSFDLLTPLESARSAEEVAQLALRATGANRFFASQFVACVSGRARNSAPGLPHRGSLYLEEWEGRQGRDENQKSISIATTKR